MLKFITAATALAVLVACDSEGIDRPNTDQSTSAQEATVTLNDNVEDDRVGSDTVSTNTDGATTTASGETVTIANGEGTTVSSDTNAVSTDTNAGVVNSDADITLNDDVSTNNSTSGVGSTVEPTNPLGGSGSSDGGTSTVDNNATTTNPLGGSGSSDGGNSGGSATPTAPTPAETPSNDQPTQVDASLNTAPPAGTTLVSTMSPIASSSDSLCIRPAKDEFNNVIYNDSGNCPAVQFHENLKFGDFILATNAWNYCASSFADWEQCISVDGSGGSVKPRWDYDWGEENQVNGQVWLVKSYPEIIYGVKSPGEYSGSTLAATPAETGLPAKVSNMPFYKIDYAFSSEEYPTRGKDFNGQRINGERNIAVEAFFHELNGDCDVNSLVRNGSVTNQRFEIMVWLDAGAERLPAAPNDYVTTQTLDGVQYDIYTKPSDPEYISFVSKSPTSSGSINWNTFVEWTKTNSHRVNEVFGRGFDTVQLQDSWCMANILLGTEIWWGNGYFQADEWKISRTVR